MLNRRDPAASPSADQAPAAPSESFLANYSDGLDLMGVTRTIRKQLRPILLFTLVLTLVGVAFAYTRPVIYQATASVAIESNQNTSNKKIEEGAPASLFGDDLQTQSQVLQSRNVYAKAVRELKLWEHPEFDPRVVSRGWVGQIKSTLGMDGGASGAAKEWTEDALVAALIGSFAAQSNSRIVTRSRVVELSFNSEDPRLAARAVNAWVKAFIDADRESRYEASRNLNVWLEDRAKELQANVVSAERELQDYREKNNLISVRGATQAMSTQQVEGMMPRVIAARVKVTELETAMKQTQSVKDGDYTTVPWVMSYGAVPSARERETSARFKVAELSQNYGFEHPRMVQAQSELREATNNLRRQVSVAVASLVREYENAKATERALDQALGAERDSTKRVNRAEFQLGLLEREVQLNRQLYEVFMSRAKEVDVTADIEKNVARVIDLAVPDFSPVSPNRPRIIFIFLLVGFMGSAGVALGLDRLDNTLKGPQDAETRLGLPVITAMPELSFADNQAENENDQSVIDQFRKEPGGLFAESIRTARTGLMLTALDDPSRVFMITSALPDEGKTSIAFNLAMAMAQSKRTLLIEADMRKPRLAKALGLPADAKGLANLVAGNAESAACMHSLPGSDLKVIPSGDHPPNPLELLSSQRFQRTIEELKTQFDFVVIDTPPVELVSDALAISRVASATLFVARAGRTAVPIVKQSLRRLDRANAKVLGVILNAVDFEKAHKYYGEYSGYGSMQYNGYVYGDDQQPGYGKSRRSGAYGYVSRVLSGGRKPDA